MKTGDLIYLFIGGLAAYVWLTSSKVNQQKVIEPAKGLFSDLEKKIEEIRSEIKKREEFAQVSRFTKEGQEKFDAEIIALKNQLDSLLNQMPQSVSIKQ